MQVIRGQPFKIWGRDSGRWHRKYSLEEGKSLTITRKRKKASEHGRP